MIVVITSGVVSNFYIPKRTKICEKQHFLSFKLGIYFWKFGKKEDILDWEQGWIPDPVVGRKGPGNFSFFSYLFSKLTFSKNYQKHYQCVKQFGTRSGPTLCRSWSRSKLFAKAISRLHKERVITFNKNSYPSFYAALNWSCRKAALELRKSLAVLVPA